jgi:hypothetical protein
MHRHFIPSRFHLSLACLPLLMAAGGPALCKEEFKEWREPAAEEWSTAADPERGIHHAIVLSDHHIIDEARTDPNLWLRGDKTPSTFYSRYIRVRLLDAIGVDQNRSVEIPYGKGMKITRIAARTLKPDGSVIPLPEKEIFDKTLISFSKQRVKARAFAFKGVESGDIVEYQYTVRFEDLDPPAIQLRYRAFVLDSEVRWYYFRQVTDFPQMESFAATEKLRKQVTYIPGYVVPNGKRFAGVIEEFPAGDKIKEGLVLRFKDLPPIPEDPYISSDREVAVTFVPFYSYPLWDAERPFWDRVARGYGESSLEFIEGQDDLDEWMAPILARPRSYESDLQGCFDRIHEAVVNVDYLDETDPRRDMPGIESVDELLDHGLGWTWQINLLLLAMLRRLGYEATVFAARDVEEGPFISHWRTSRQFTTWGVMVKESDADLRALLPAIPGSGPRSVPWQIGGTKALLYDTTPKGRQNPFETLMDIPPPRAEGNEHSLSGTFRLDDTGALVGDLHGRVGCVGYPYLVHDLQEKYRKLPKDAWEAARREILDVDLKADFTADSIAVSPEGIGYACSLRVEGLVVEAGSTIAVQLGRVRCDDYALPEGPREFVLDFHHPRVYTSDVALAIDAGMSVASLPSPTRIRGRIAEYEQECVSDGDLVRMRRRLTIPSSRYWPEAAEDLRTFFRDVNSASEQPIVLRRGAGQ